MIRSLLLTAAALCAALTASSPALAQDRALPRSTVLIVDGADGPRVNIKANQVAFKSLMAKVAAGIGRKLEGAELISRDPAVSALMEDADLREALLVISGSVGLRATLRPGVLHVAEDLGPYPTQRELFTRADAWYARALFTAPKSILAPDALWHRARMWQQAPGETSRAGKLFTQIYTDYPEADVAPRARIEASRTLGEAGDWTEAVICLEQLLANPAPNLIRTRARRLLAGALTHLADSSDNPHFRLETALRAHLQLDVLEAEAGAVASGERRRRYIVRSRAYSITGQPSEALRSLDLARAHGSDAANDPEFTELSARAFECAGQHDQAVRAWLRYAEMMDGEARADAYCRGARAAQSGGSHLSAISIVKLASDKGLSTPELQSIENQAWAALDFPAPHLGALADVDRLERGRSLLSRDMADEAAEALRDVFDHREAIADPAVRLDLGLTYASALARSGRLSSAVFALRKTAQEQAHAADRRKVYLAASSLFEEAGEIELAIKAQEGRL